MVAASADATPKFKTARNARHPTIPKRCARKFMFPPFAGRIASGKWGTVPFATPYSPFAQLHRGPKHPRRKLGAAEIKTLALGRLARCGLQHQLKDALAALLHGLLAVEDGAAIDVHVVFHPGVHRRVGRKLDRRRGLAAEHAAAAGGEANEVGAARHLPG